MKQFASLHQAVEYAAAGHQGLHPYASEPRRYPNAPKCFRTTDRWAYLFDQDLARLKMTARHLGIHKIVVDHIGDRYQHVDLCGMPLQKAIDLCKEREALCPDQSVQTTPTS